VIIISDEEEFWVNEIWTPNYGLILAACDKELLGKKLKKGSLDIYISPEFYGGRLVRLDELILLMQKAVSLNLVGEKVIEVAEKIDLVHKDAKIYFRDSDGRYIPHAITIKVTL